LNFANVRPHFKHFAYIFFSFFFFNQQLSHSEEDTHWYNDLMNQLYERNKKLRFPDYKPKQKIHLNIGSSASAVISNVAIQIFPSTSDKPSKTEIEPKKEVFNYAPRSPEPDVLQKKSDTPISSKTETTPFRRERPQVYIDEDVPVEGLKRPNIKKKHYVQCPWAHNPKAVNIMKNWYPLQFKLAYPKKSVLNASEQKEFLDLHSRFRNRTHLTEKEVKQYKTYSHMKNMIIKERELFLEYSKKYYEVATEDYEFMSEPVMQYVNELISCLEKDTGTFERFYSKLEDFSLKQLDPHQRASFEFKEKLVNLVGDAAFFLMLMSFFFCSYICF